MPPTHTSESPMPKANREWMPHVHAGLRYLQTAWNGRQRPAVFSNELRFQLSAMALEKLLVGIWTYHGYLPADHTLTGLSLGATELCSLDPLLAQRIGAIDRFDNMCVLAPVRRDPPSDQTLNEILNTGRELTEFVVCQIPELDRALIHLDA